MTDDLEVTAPALGLGATETHADEDHGAHTFLYVPDLSERTGYSTHRVPERQSEKPERREMGFRR